MRKMFDHMDNAFRSAYLTAEEEPSDVVWERIRENLADRTSKREYLFWIKSIVIVVAGILTSQQINKEQKILANDKWIRQQKIPSAIIRNRNEIASIHQNLSLPESPQLSDTPPIGYSLMNFGIQQFTSRPQLNRTHIASTRNFTSQQYTPAAKVSFRFKPHWTISPLVSIGRAAYRLDSDLPANYQRMKMIRQGERKELSFTAGILVTWNFKRNIGLQTGLIYSNTRIQIDPHKIYAFEKPDGDAAYQLFTSSGYAYINPKFSNNPAIGDSLYTTRVKHNFNSLSIPLTVIINVPARGKLSFHPGAGVAANLIVKSGLETEVTDAMNHETVTLRKLQGIKNYFWSAHADAEVQYQVRPSLSVSLRPSVNYALSSVTDNEFVETFPYSFNVALGVNYKF